MGHLVPMQTLHCFDIIMWLHDNYSAHFTCLAGAFLAQITSVACDLFSISSVLSIWSWRKGLMLMTTLIKQGIIVKNIGCVARHVKNW